MTVAADRSEQSAESIKLFNAGCHARLRGERLREDAPHDWRRGWRDVELCWGSLAKWPVMALPEVR